MAAEPSSVPANQLPTPPSSPSSARHRPVTAFAINKSYQLPNALPALSPPVGALAVSRTPSDPSTPMSPRVSLPPTGAASSGTRLQRRRRSISDPSEPATAAAAAAAAASASAKQHEVIFEPSTPPSAGSTPRNTAVILQPPSHAAPSSAITPQLPALLKSHSIPTLAVVPVQLGDNYIAGSLILSSNAPASSGDVVRSPRKQATSQPPSPDKSPALLPHDGASSVARSLVPGKQCFGIVSVLLQRLSIWPSVPLSFNPLTVRANTISDNDFSNVVVAHALANTFEWIDGWMDE